MTSYILSHIAKMSYFISDEISEISHFKLVIAQSMYRKETYDSQNLHDEDDNQKHSLHERKSRWN